MRHGGQVQIQPAEIVGVRVLFGLQFSELLSDFLPLRFQFADAHQPLVLRFEGFDVCGDTIFFGIQFLHFSPEFGLLFFGQQLCRVKFPFQFLKPFLFLFLALESLLRKFGVEVGSGDFFQQFAFLTFLGLQKRRKIALRQHHRTQKSRIIQARNGGDAFHDIGFLGFQNLITVQVAEFHFGRLYFAIKPVARTPQRPFAAVPFAFHLKIHFGKAVGSVVAHGFLGVASAETRRIAIQGQRDGIQDGGFARSRRPDNGKQTRIGNGTFVKGNVLLTAQRIDVLEPDT